MRMWLCDPKIMCQKHLCGEHVEMHMFLGTLQKGKKIDGFLKNNLFQPRSLLYRHDQLMREMQRRHYNHKSEIKWIDFYKAYNSLETTEKKHWDIDKDAALKDLLDRCPECRKRFTEFQSSCNQPLLSAR